MKICFKYRLFIVSLGLLLDHDEVLRICAAFLTTKQTFQDIVVDRFPVLLIDESQDTKKVLMDAFLTLEENHRGKFCLGLLGDVMQRIYLDGKERIQDCIPIGWAKPCKKMNHAYDNCVIILLNHAEKVSLQVANSPHICYNTPKPSNRPSQAKPLIGWPG